MPQAACTLCGTTFPRRDTRPVTHSGWYADGWVYFHGESRARLQPYCPTCKPAAEVCWEAVGTSAGSPWFLYQPEPGGSVRVTRFAYEGSAWRKVGVVVTTVEAVRRAMVLPEEPGRMDAVWATLES